LLVADFYLNHNVPRNVAALLQAWGHHASTARELGLDRATDDQHFLAAAEHGLILVGHHREDFILLHDAWRRWAAAWGVSRPHAGILIVPQPPEVTSEQIAEALRVLVERGESLTNQLFLWRQRIGWVRRPG
jgi:hypothetical protein